MAAWSISRHVWLFFVAKSGHQNTWMLWEVPPRKSEGACLRTACTFDAVASQKSMHCTVMSLLLCSFLIPLDCLILFFPTWFLSNYAAQQTFSDLSSLIGWLQVRLQQFLDLGHFSHSPSRNAASVTSLQLVFRHGLPPAISWLRRCRPASGPLLCVPPPSGLNEASSPTLTNFFWIYLLVPMISPLSSVMDPHS